MQLSVFFKFIDSNDGSAWVANDTNPTLYIFISQSKPVGIYSIVFEHFQDILESCNMSKDVHFQKADLAKCENSNC